MRFLDDVEIRTLDEPAQDRVLRDRALKFAGAHPRRVLELAVIKAGRFWSPWPNADQFGAWWVALVSAGAVIPVYALIVLGAWDHRRDVRALLLALGPVLYFMAVHLVFVSSIRYRIPALVPALSLAGGAVTRRISARTSRGFG